MPALSQQNQFRLLRTAKILCYDLQPLRYLQKCCSTRYTRDVSLVVRGNSASLKGVTLCRANYCPVCLTKATPRLFAAFRNYCPWLLYAHTVNVSSPELTARPDTTLGPAAPGDRCCGVLPTGG